MSSSTANISIQPVNVLWRAKGEWCYDFKDATASGLGGQYVSFYLPTGVGYYAWFDENDTDVDPAPASLTEIEVDYAASALPSAIASAFQAAVNAVAGFTATVSGTLVTIKADAFGSVVAPSVNTASSLILTFVRKGKNYDLGFLQGDVELNFAPSNFILQAHQTGITPLASLNQGFETIEVATVLLESTKSKLRDIYEIYGGRETPSMGTEVYGAGSAAQGKNLLLEAGVLTLKPVNAVNEVDSAHIMLAVPVPDTLVYSGENPKTLSVTWQGFIDTSFNSKINAVAFGDVFQTGL